MKTNQSATKYSKLVLLLILITSTSCSSPTFPTKYQAIKHNYGYSSTQLDINKFAVYFNGNWATSLLTAEDYCLLRCSELAIENGFMYFELVNDKAFNKSKLYSDVHGGTYSVNSPRVKYVINCYKDKPKTDNPELLKAQYIVNSIRKKYKSEFSSNKPGSKK